MLLQILFIFLLYGGTCSSGDDTKDVGLEAPLQFKNLVLEGGGFKGISYIGAFKSLAKHGYYDYRTNRWQFENITGTSIGCLFGFLLALNVSPVKMEKIAYDINYQTIFDSDFLDLLNMPSYHDTYIFAILNYIDMARRFLIWSMRFLYYWTRANSPGLDTGTAIENWLFDVIVRQYSEPPRLRELITRDMTLQQFYNLQSVGNDEDDKSKKILFTCLAAQLIKVKILRFNAHESPSVTLSDAILSSIALPVLFKPYGSSDFIMKESYPVVDGGVFNNFPIYDYDFAGELSRQTLGLSLHMHPTITSTTNSCNVAAVIDEQEQQLFSNEYNIIYSKYFAISTYKFFRYIMSAIIGSRWYIQYSTDPRNCNRIVYLDSPLHLLGTSKRICKTSSNEERLKFDTNIIKKAINIAERNTDLFMFNYNKIKCNV